MDNVLKATTVALMLATAIAAPVHDGARTLDSALDGVGSVDAMSLPLSMSADDLHDIQVATRFAWAAYWTGTPDPRAGEPGFDLDVCRNTSHAMGSCFDPSDGVSNPDPAVNGFVTSPTRGRCCRAKIDDWDYQGRIEAHNTFGSGRLTITGLANADVYYSDASRAGGQICYVAIRGTDAEGGLSDFLTDLDNSFTESIPDAATGPYEVGIGFKRYYDAIRPYILRACNGRTMWVTGHSLGSAAAQIAHAYGDAVKSISFGSPKAFVELARPPRGSSGQQPHRTCRNRNSGVACPFHRRGVTCRADGQRIANMTTFWSHDETVGGANGIHDVVASAQGYPMANGFGTACGEHHYEIYKAATGYGIRESELDAPRPLRRRGRNGRPRMSVHAEPTSYYPWAMNITHPEETPEPSPAP